MAKDRLLIAELAEALAAELKIDARQADEFLKTLSAVLEEGLIADGHVKIKGLGIFKVIRNEPRKSVDVNTGEDIIIEGFYKATFTPDTAFKDAVNEPFAHLEPVVIGGDPTRIQDAVKPVVPVTKEETIDPLKMLHEQANEIKGILSEMGSMKRNRKKKVEVEPVEQVVVETKVVEQEVIVEESVEPEVIAEQTIEPEVKEENSVESVVIEEKSVEPEIVENKVVESEIVIPVVSETVEEEIPEITNQQDEEPVTVIQTPEPEVDYKENQPIKFRKYHSDYNQSEIDKRRGPKPGRRLDIIFIFVMIIVAAIFILKDYDIFHEFSKWMKKEEKQEMQFEAPEITDEMLTDSIEVDSLNVSEKDSLVKTVASESEKVQAETKTREVKPQPQPQPQKTVQQVVKPQPQVQNTQVDTLRMLFDKPRVYKEFIGSEEVRVGSRLTRIAERHYGVKDFWVYIYEANRDKFTTPDDVEPGTILRIPKLDPRIANPKNPRCMQYARELHDRYVKKK